MSLVESTIEGALILDSEIPEIRINLDEEPIVTVYEKEAIILLKMGELPEVYEVRIDLDNINNLDSIPPPIRFTTSLQIMFGKAVIGRRKTFGQTSLALVNTITTHGYIIDIDAAAYSGGLYGNVPYGGTYQSGDHYSSGIYGSGIYNDVAVPEMETAIAELSLAFHVAPQIQTNHSIKLRARTVTGSGGVIKAALYEGATRRSGSDDLVTPPLTNSFEDYTLVIPDAAADTITNYSNLSIKFWGYVPTGTSLEFEVSRIYLELPSA